MLSFWRRAACTPICTAPSSCPAPRRSRSPRATSRFGGMDLGLGDRVFLVTGGARGLGRATADVLDAEGGRVVLSGRSEETLAAAVGELGDHASYVVGDNADPATPARLVTAARDRWGRLDGALVSVGGPPRGPGAAGDRRQGGPGCGG